MNTPAQKTLATSLDVLSLASLSLFSLSLSLFSTLFIALSRSHTLFLSVSLSRSLSLFLSRSLSRSFSPALFSLALSRSLYFFLSLSLLSLFIHIHIPVDIHADVESGMAEEHLRQPDSNEGFSTNNYGVRYTLVTQVCNKFAHLTQFLSSLFDLLK